MGVCHSHISALSLGHRELLTAAVEEIRSILRDWDGDIMSTQYSLGAKSHGSKACIF